MKKFFMICFVSLMALMAWSEASAQQDRSYSIVRQALMGLNYEVKAGINFGGASPLPLPREIRKIESFSPTFCFSIEGDVIKWFGEKKQWGMIVGLRLENKGMKTKARVKNYGMAIIGDDGNMVEGNWTGMVRTKYRSTLFSIPVMAACKINKRLRLQFGPYVSFQTSGDFTGNVFEGYLRKGSPIGDRVDIQNDIPGGVGSYDFSSDLRTVQVGVQGGVTWKAFKHLIVSGDLTWGLSDIFKKDFDTITFDMYPIYLNIGFGYAF